MPFGRHRSTLAQERQLAARAWAWRDLRCVSMEAMVLRVRLVSGDQLDLTYEHDAVDENEVIQHVVETLAEDSGVLRTRHGDRLIVLYGRGVAAFEVAPRGAVL